MVDSLTKKIINLVIKFSGKGGKKNILRTALYAADAVRKTPGSYTYDVHQRMNIDNILPAKAINRLEKECTLSDIIQDNKKIKIRIFFPAAWSNIGTVYEELCKDSRYQVIVITEDYPNFIHVMEEKNCDFIRLNNYDITIDKPDILILTSYSATSPKLNFPGIRDYVKLVISLFPLVVINHPNMDQNWKFVYNAYEFCKPDYYLFESLVYDNCENYIDKDKAVHMGSPKFDELYYKLQKTDDRNPMWDKLQGKKVFLLATDHGLNEYYPIDAFSMDFYLKDIFSYFADHPEAGLIFRPHPYLIREMRQSGCFWSDDDIKKLINYCENSSNIVWDETADYCSAFVRCDAMLVDANCGFTVTFLATGKPICRLLRQDIEVNLIHPELKDYYYYSKNFSDCRQFIENIIQGKDPLADCRQEAFRVCVKNFDGQNGNRIKNFIDQTWEITINS